MKNTQTHIPIQLSESHFITTSFYLTPFGNGTFPLTSVPRGAESLAHVCPCVCWHVCVCVSVLSEALRCSCRTRAQKCQWYEAFQLSSFPADKSPKKRARLSVHGAGLVLRATGRQLGALSKGCAQKPSFP